MKPGRWKRALPLALVLLGALGLGGAVAYEWALRSLRFPWRTLGARGDGTELIFGVAVSPDGARVATVSDADRVIAHLRIWSVASGTLERDLALDARSLHVAFSPRGDLVAAPGRKHVFLFPLDGGAPRTIEGDFDAPGIAFSPSGELLALSTRSGRIEVHTVADGRLVRTLADPAHENADIDDLDWQGDVIAAGKFSGTLRLFFSVRGFEPPLVLDRLVNTNQGSELLTLEYARDIHSTVLAPRADLVACASESQFELWKTDGTLVKTFHSPTDASGAWKVAISPDGRLLATGTASGVLALYRLPDLELVAETGKSASPEDRDAVRGLAFSGTGDFVAVARGNEVTLWRVPR